MIEILYQEHPREATSWRLARSYTLSRLSYNLAAKREAVALLVNGRVPNYVITLNYLEEMPVSRIKYLWSKHSRRLLRAGITGRVAIEITKDQRRRHPLNRVHYHIIVQDSRTPQQLRQVVKEVCMCEMLPDTFKVKCKPIDNWRGSVWYFVKYRVARNYMFRSKLGLKKFYTIGNWWTNKDGTVTTKESILNEMQRYAITKRWLKASEKFITVERRSAEWELPTDYTKLQAVLDKMSDKVLYDWFSILLGKPTVFETTAPRWLIDALQSQPQKRYDLLDAIYARLCYTTKSDIIIAMKIYHDHEL